MRFLDYVLMAVLTVIAGLAVASLLGVGLGALDPVEAVGRVMDAVG